MPGAHEGGCVFSENGHDDREPAGDHEPDGGIWLAAIGFVGLALLAGVVGHGTAAAGLREWYARLALPPLAAGAWVFGWARGGAAVLVGLAAWLIWRDGCQGPGRRLLAGRGLRLWGWQLLCGAGWVPAFFGLRSPALGLLMILSMVALLAAATRSFARLRGPAAWLMLPSLLWACYVTYLTAAVWWLNRLA